MIMTRMLTENDYESSSVRLSVQNRNFSGLEELKTQLKRIFSMDGSISMRKSNGGDLLLSLLMMAVLCSCKKEIRRSMRIHRLK